MSNTIFEDKPSNEEVIRKLRFIPVDVLRKITIDLFRSWEHELIPFIEQKFNKKVKKPLSFIGKLGIEELSLILSYRKNLPKERIETLYEEFIHGRYPTLFLFEINKAKNISHHDLYQGINKEFSDINKESSLIEDVKEKDFKIESTKLEHNIHEIIFTFSNRIDFVNPQTNKPDYVYGKNFGIIWISATFNSMIIRCNSWRVSYILKRMIQNILSGDIYSLYLNKNLVDSIINPNTVIAGGYKKLFPSKDDVESKNLRDHQLLSKEEGKKTNKEYERKSSIHKLSLFGEEINISITENGKIHINKQIKKSDLKEWAFKILNDILSKLSSFKKKNYGTYIRSINSMDLKSLKDIGKTTKNIFVELSIAFQFFKDKNESNFPTRYIINNFYNNFTQYANFFLDFHCPTCSSSSIKCANCNGEVDYAGNKFALKCKKCGKVIENLNEEILCTGGHKIRGTLADYTIAILSKSGKDKLNDLFKEFEINYSIKEEETIIIRNRNIGYNYNLEKIEYSIEDIEEFKNLVKLNKISQAIKSSMLNNLQITQEKCENHTNENCRKCLVEPPKDYPCIQRVIGSFFHYSELHAHSGHEFGDFSFRANIEGKDIRIPCIVKPYKFKKTKHKINRIDLTMGNDDRLFNQSFIELNSDTTEMIGVITGGYIDSKLKEAIKDLARYKQKKVLFVDMDDLIRIYSRFDWQNKQPMDSLE